MDPLIWLLGAGLVIALAAGGYLVVRRRGDPVAVPYRHFRCPRCKRRLRFCARQAGHAGQCSHCHFNLTFPSVSHAID